MGGLRLKITTPCLYIIFKGCCTGWGAVCWTAGRVTSNFLCLIYSSCQFFLIYVVNNLFNCLSPQQSVVTVVLLIQVVVSCMFLLPNSYIVILECENLDECVPLWKICNIWKRQIYTSMFKRCIWVFEHLGIWHNLYIPVGHLAILVLAVVTNMIKINFLVCVCN